VTSPEKQIIPESRLTCERCSDQGYVETGLGCLACLQCSAAANLPWIPASHPPASESIKASHSILCLGVVVTPDSRFMIWLRTGHRATGGPLPASTAWSQPTLRSR
jgi:hypothetical protein